jgi:hypothetical protein
VVTTPEVARLLEKYRVSEKSDAVAYANSSAAEKHDDVQTNVPVLGGEAFSVRTLVKLARHGEPLSFSARNPPVGQPRESVSSEPTSVAVAFAPADVSFPMAVKA